VKPPRSLLDKDFRYTPSAKTDLAATFRRIRKELEAQQQRQAANESEVAAKVAPLTTRRKA